MRNERVLEMREEESAVLFLGVCIQKKFFLCLFLTRCRILCSKSLFKQFRLSCDVNKAGGPKYVV